MLKRWLTYLALNEDGFFGIGQGPSKQEQNQYGNLSNIGNFGTSTGESDISAASDFWQAILSGDSTKLSKVLGPEYSAITKRGGEELKTLSEFGTRSGGTAAAQQQVGDKMRGEASALEGSLYGSAASNLGTMGQGLLSTGLSADEAAFSAAKTIQEQHAAKMNDIFKSIADVAAGVVTGGASLGITGIGGSGPNSGGFGDASNFGGNVADL